MTGSTEKKKAESNSDDRLSNLPLDVLHYILSYLATRDVIGLSVLSKRWRFLWTSMPYLKLSDSPFSSIEIFIDFVWLTLSLRDGSDIKQLRLGCCPENSTVHFNKSLNTLLVVAARLNVEEIHLDGSFNLPGCLLDSKCLRVLKLISRSHKILQLPEVKGVTKLTSLHLEGVELDDSSFGSKLFPSLPFLEDLAMVDCYMRTVDVFEVNATRLKILTFIDSHDDFRPAFRVIAPNLKSFCYAGSLLSDCSLENLSSLHNASVNMIYSYLHEEEHVRLFKLIKGFHGVEVLRLSSRFLKFFPTKIDKPGCFLNSLYNLKCLMLCVECCRERHMESIFCLLKHSPNLETLVLDFKETQQKTDLKQPLPFLMDHLKTVEISNFEGRPLGLELVNFLLSNANVLETMAIKYTNLSDKEESFEKVLAFPKASPHVDISFPGFGMRRIFWEIETYSYQFYDAESDSDPWFTD